MNYWKRPTPLNAERVAERIDEVSAIIRAELDKAQHPAEPVEMAASLSISEGLQARIDRVNKLLEARSSQAQQPGKVLTDDMIETAGAVERRMYLQETCSDKEAEIWSKGVMSGLRQARDNGYLSTGLTVEGVMDIAKEEVFEWWNGERVFRTRLTAAIQAKQNLKA